MKLHQFEEIEDECKESENIAKTALNYIVKYSFDDIIQERIIEKSYKMHYFQFLLFGICSEFSFAFVMGAAEKLSIHYHMVNFLPLFILLMNSTDILARYVLAKYLLQISHMKRIGLMIVCNAMTFTLIGFAVLTDNIAGYYFCLLGAASGGFAVGISETTGYGFLKSYPDGMLSAYGTGVGLAGLVSASIYLSFMALKMSYSTLFLLQLTHILLAYTSFSWIQEKYIEANKMKFQTEYNQILYSKEPRTADEVDISNQEEISPEELNPNVKFSCSIACGISKITAYQIINLFFGYFCTYTIILVLSDRIAINLIEEDKEDTFVIQNAYIIFGTAYSVGNTLGRLSIKWKTTPLLHYLMLSSLIIGGFLVLEFFYMWITSAYLLILIMLAVGLIQGTAVINGLDQVLDHRNLETKEKELAVSIILIFVNLGVLLATIFGIGLNQTVFKKNEM